MKRIAGIALVLALTAAVLAVALPGRDAAEALVVRSGEVNALLLVCNAYGANYNLVRDVLELYGWNLTTVGVTPTVSKCFWGEPIAVDKLVTEVTDVSAYDCLIIMPSRSRFGNAHSQLLESPEALQLVRDADAQGLLLAAFCGGVRVLAAADVIEGLQVTGTPLYEQEYVDAGATYVGEPTVPVRDGRIVTTMDGQYNCERVCEVMRAAVDSLRAARGF